MVLGAKIGVRLRMGLTSLSHTILLYLLSDYFRILLLLLLLLIILYIYVTYSRFPFGIAGGYGKRHASKSYGSTDTILNMFHAPFTQPHLSNDIYT